MKEKTKIILPSDDDELKLTLSKAYDLYRKAEFSYGYYFTKFLTPLESATIAQRFPKTNPTLNFFGGYDDAQRVIASFCENDDDYIPFPICAVIAKVRCDHTLSHRDFLGAVLSLGIKREIIGDILVRDDDAVIICLENHAEFIAENLTCVASASAKTSIVYDLSSLKLKSKFETIKRTVSSLRADCIISAFTGKSRSESTNMIERGLVVHNFRQLKSADSKVKDNDIMSVRGFGKFVVQTENTLTKKGKIYVELKKYI